MDNFACIYKILKTLEKAMDYQEFDSERISHDNLGISQERWNKYIEMMDDVGLIKNVRIKNYIGGDSIVDISDVRITLKGLEYLTENSLMQKAYRTAKGIKALTI